MNLFQRLRSNPKVNEGPSYAERSGLVSLMETWNSMDKTEKLDEDFLSYVKDGVQGNGVVWSLVLMRMTFFSQMEFQWQDLVKRTLFGDQSLQVLENPWPNGSTQELLARMEQDVSTAGNSYIYRANPITLQRLRPDWVEIGTDGQELIGYFYQSGGARSGNPKKFLLPDEVAHWSPYPDPLAMFRGMSWITPVVREIIADKKMTLHKQKFFDNAATPNLLIKNTKMLDDDSRLRLRRQLEMRHEGADNAYRTLVLEGGADATIIGATMQQMSFDAIQAAGENRVASAAGVPGIVAGFKEGLQAATYSNYAQAKRHYVDGTLTFNWGSVCKALETLVGPPPKNARLWYDTSRIPALKEDRAALSSIIHENAQAMEFLVLAGYDPKDVELYVTTGERPEGGIKHTGLVYAAKGAEPEPDAMGKLGIQATAPPGQQAPPAADAAVPVESGAQPTNGKQPPAPTKPAPTKPAPPVKKPAKAK